MKDLSGFDIEKLTGLSIPTIYSRFRSKYAEKKWGVRKEYLEDGTYHYVVSKKDFERLWKSKRLIKRGREVEL